MYEIDSNDINADRLNAANESLESFYEGKVKGITIRARARWHEHGESCLLYTSPSPRDQRGSRMPSSA